MFFIGEGFVIGHLPVPSGFYLLLGLYMCYGISIPGQLSMDLPSDFYHSSSGCLLVYRHFYLVCLPLNPGGTKGYWTVTIVDQSPVLGVLYLVFLTLDIFCVLETRTLFNVCEVCSHCWPQMGYPAHGFLRINFVWCTTAPVFNRLCALPPNVPAIYCPVCSVVVEHLHHL